MPIKLAEDWKINKMSFIKTKSLFFALASFASIVCAHNIALHWAPGSVIVGGGGPDIYYYASGWTSTTTGTSITAGWAPQSYSYGNAVVVSEAGTVTEFGIRAQSGFGSPSIKLALYDSTGDLVVDGGTVALTATNQWWSVSVSQAISSGTYHVRYSGSTEYAHINYVSGSDGDGAAVAYASFPPSTIGGYGAESGNSFGARIYVD